jgi:hypothetical protein
VYKVAASALKLAPVTDAKVDGAAAWAAPYIQALIDAGFKLPSTNYKANATRGQTIEVAYDLYLAGQVQPLSDVSAVVNADDTITVTGKTAGGVDSVKVAIGTAAEAAATLNADGSFTYTSAAQAVGTYTVKVVAYKGSAVAASVEKSVTIDGFVVDSVKVLNAKQIAVSFNKAVQSGTAVGGHKYGIVTSGSNTNAYYKLGISGNVYPKDAALSSDAKTVTLTFDDFSAHLNSYVQFEVSSGLKSASGKSLTSYKQAILLTDTTVPTVSSVSYSGTTATFTLSEPVKPFTAQRTTVTLNGTQLQSEPISGTYYEAVADAQGDITSVKIYNLSSDTSYSLYIIGLVDLAGNIGDYNTTFTLAADTVAPTVTAVTVSGTTITVKYSEALSAYGVVYATSPSDIAGLRLTATVNDYDSDNYTVKYNASGWLGGATYKNVSIKIQNYADLVGNTGSAYTTNVTIGKDTTNPSVVSAQYAYDGVNRQYVVAIKFDESLSSVGSGAINVKYTSTSSLVKSGTVNVSSGRIGFDVNNDGDVTDSGEDYYLVIPVNAFTFLDSNGPTTLSNGTYSISVPANVVFDNAASTGATANLGNNAGSVSFTVNSNTSAGTVKLVSVTEESNGKLLFVFNSNLTQAALDPSKFLINGTALPSTAVLYFSDDYQHVVAELPEGYLAASGTRTVKVANIVDENGNTLNTDSTDNYQRTVYLKENTKPVAQSVSLISDKQIAVTFSETLDSAVTAPTGITVKVNGNTVTPFNYTYSNNVLYINTANSEFTSSQTITVTFASSTVKDLAGNTAKDVTVTK